MLSNYREYQIITNDDTKACEVFLERESVAKYPCLNDALTAIDEGKIDD